MIQLADLQSILADILFGGNTTIAGLAIFAVTMSVIFLLIKNVTASLLISLPVTLIFSSLNIINGDNANI